MISDDEAKSVKEHLAVIKPTLGGKIFYWLLPFRKKVVLENIKKVFDPVLTPAEQQHLALCFYSHVATSLYENLSSRFKPFDSLKNQVIVEGYEHLLSASQSEKGVLVLTGHFGNWEYAPLGGLAQFPVFRERFYFIRKTLSWQWLEKILFRRFFNAGLRVIPKKQAIPKVLSALAQNDVVIFVLDQAASLKNKQGVATHFFGLPVGTYRSLASVARSSGAPVIPGTSFRREDGKHVLVFHEQLSWVTHLDPKQEIIANTEQYNRVIEQFILKHPEQWLWMHRRWKRHSEAS